MIIRQCLLLTLLLAVISCTPKLEKRLKEGLIENPTTQTEIDKNAIINYAIANEMDVQATESGIHYVITAEGTGDAHPTTSSRVKAHYTGKLLDGTKFDSSLDRGTPLEFGLGQVIKGWQEAIPLLKKGGKGTFLIPSELAYGKRGAGKVIPPNSVLLFEIELLDF
ncbi:MAG: FKBP-type peptidyl-prolyl cis-trans isomerase [Bacteroidota bacterium]